MRPTDENQAASTRPNLMSPSHRGGEDSILAKLERDPARRHGKPARGRLAWYGGGLLVAAGLTATLAWLAADNGKPAPLLAQAPAAPSPAPEAPRQAALIVDPPSDPPPLRLLEPEPKAPEPVRVPVRPPAAKPPVAAKTSRPVPALPRQEARGMAPAKAKAVAAKPAPRPAARTARASPPARQGEPVDSDVALISAVISHAGEATRDEGLEACQDDGCRPPRP